MNLMISKTLSGPTDGAARANAAAEFISYAIGECILGRVLVARSVKGVCAILIGADHEELKADLIARFPRAKTIVNEKQHSRRLG